MPITIGDNTITGLASGGLPNGIVNSNSIASGTIARDRLASNCLVNVVATNRNSNASYGGDSGWQNYISFTFTMTYASRIMLQAMFGNSWESGPGALFGRFILNGSKVGVNTCVGRQTTANTCAGGSMHWFADAPAGTNTILLQVRNAVGGSTVQVPFWTVEGEGVVVLLVNAFN